MFNDSYFRYKEIYKRLKQIILFALILLSNTILTTKTETAISGGLVKNNLPFNHIYDSSYSLKEIPKFNSDQKLKTKKNPFLIKNKYEENNSLFLNNLKVTGIINIDNKIFTIVSSVYGTDTFEVGENIGDGYQIKKINSNPASVLISNNKYSKLFVLED